MRSSLWKVACGMSLALAVVLAGKGESANWNRSGWYRSNVAPTYYFVPNTYYGGYSYSIPAYGNYPTAAVYSGGYGSYYFPPAAYGTYQGSGYNSYYYSPGYGPYEAPGYSTYYYNQGP